MPNLDQTYKIKWISITETEKVAIITQNQNGPCPLVAIINCLSISKRIKFTENLTHVTGKKLIDELADVIVASKPNMSAQLAEFEYELKDALDILPKLQNGLDVNVGFRGISHYEYTQNTIILNFLCIPLHHGWVYDPSDGFLANAINTLTYNQLAEKIASMADVNDPKSCGRILVSQMFLEDNASQLTEYGLSQLKSEVKDSTLFIFFRNNHFATALKHQGEIYILLTDVGYLNYSDIVWERLTSVHGGGEYVDGKFSKVSPRSASTSNIIGLAKGVKSFFKNFNKQ
jgi:hypothetical protein